MDPRFDASTDTIDEYLARHEGKQLLRREGLGADARVDPEISQCPCDPLRRRRRIEPTRAQGVHQRLAPLREGRAAFPQGLPALARAGLRDALGRRAGGPQLPQD